MEFFEELEFDVTESGIIKSRKPYKYAGIGNGTTQENVNNSLGGLFDEVCLRKFPCWEKEASYVDPRFGMRKDKTIICKLWRYNDVPLKYMEENLNTVKEEVEIITGKLDMATFKRALRGMNLNLKKDGTLEEAMFE